MVPSPEDLVPDAIAYLERQAWFQQAVAGRPVAHLVLSAYDVLREEPPGLARLLFRRGEQHFQLLAGWREASSAASVLQDSETSLIGTVEVGENHVLAYEALADDELILDLLRVVTGGREHAQRVRRVSTLVSHASVVFDERLFMKCYRVLEPGERPEAEMMFRLDAVGFNAMLAPVARWRDHGFDLALVREFLPSALEGRLLALTSLRDLLAHASVAEEAGGLAGLGREHLDADAEAASAGGDLAAEMHRVGMTTGHLHAALVHAFGSQVARPSALAEAIASSARSSEDELHELASMVAALPPGSAGCAIRLHGDYHLRRVMRSESGWLVAGFGDDPMYATARPRPSLAPRVGSPVEDLADMCFALHRVAEEALNQRCPGENDLAARLARAWERRNRGAFLEGYTAVPETTTLLPEDEATTSLLLRAFQAVRDRRYEATFAEA